jgi:hypothetical protein
MVHSIDLPADRFRKDPGWGRRSASQLQSLDTEMLSEEGNFSEPAGLNRALIGRAEAMDSGYRTILGLDFAEIHV